MKTKRTKPPKDAPSHFAEGIAAASAGKPVERNRYSHPDMQASYEAGHKWETERQRREGETS